MKKLILACGLMAFSLSVNAQKIVKTAIPCPEKRDGCLVFHMKIDTVWNVDSLRGRLSIYEEMSKDFATSLIKKEEEIRVYKLKISVYEDLVRKLKKIYKTN